MAAKAKKPARKQVTKKKSPAKKKSRKKLSTTRRATSDISEDTLEIDFFRERATEVITNSEQISLDYHSTLKLQVELVPGSCFWSNVRSNVTRTQWDKIRHAVYQKANYTCEICGGKGTQHPVECHEVWVYDDVTLTQRLSFFQAICPLCHEVKHIGLAGVRGYGERATTRFQEVNALKKTSAEKILAAVWKQWRIRSRQEWILDIEH